MSAPIPKKRKQNNTDEKLPKRPKTVSYDDKPINVSMVDDSGSWLPVFTSAPGLQLPNDLSFHAYQRGDSKGSKGNARSSTETLLHSASHPRLDYVATESADSLERATKHYVGVYDPSTSSLKIVPAKHMTVRSTLKRGFVADQKLAAAELKAVREGPAETAASTYAAARTALGEAFGTKKARKAIRSAAVNAVASPRKSQTVNGKIVRSEHTDAVLASAQVKHEMDGDEGLGDADERKEALTGLVHDAHPRPKPNLYAEVPEDIYKLSKLIGRLELDLVDIEDWQQVIKDDGEITTASRFVADRWWTVVQQEDERKLRALKFLQILLQWIDALEGRGSSKKLPRKEKMDELMQGIPFDLVAKIRTKFAPSGSFLNTWDVQKVMLHVCAISIVLDNCTSDVFHIQGDLKLTSSEIGSLCKELGCKVENMNEKDAERKGLSKQEASAHRIARLRVPFTLPEVRQRRQRR